MKQIVSIVSILIISQVFALLVVFTSAATAEPLTKDSLIKALKDYATGLSLVNKRPVGRRAFAVNLYEARTELYEKMGKKKLAIADWRTIRKLLKTEPFMLVDASDVKTAFARLTKPANDTRPKEIFGIYTGKSGGLYDGVGRSMCKIFEKSKNFQIQCYTNKDGGGSVGNIRKLFSSATVGFALLRADHQYAAIKRTGQFADLSPERKLRSVLSFHGAREGVTPANDKGLTLLVDHSSEKEVVREVVKLVVQHIEQLKKSNPLALRRLSRKDLANTGLTAPLHPGAIEAFKELGLLKHADKRLLTVGVLIECQQGRGDIKFNACNRIFKSGQLSGKPVKPNVLANVKSELTKSYYHRGSASYKSKQYDQAIGHFTEAIKLDPKYVDALNDRAWVYFKMGNADKGLPDAQLALKLDPKSYPAWDTLGAIHEAMGDKAKAIKAYRKAMALDPSHKTSKENLKRLGALK